MEQTINNIKLKTVDTEYDVYFDMALTMLEEIIEHNKKNEQTVMIVPVGPTQQYPILAEMVNRLNVSLKNVHFFNMDEYMLSPDKMMDENDTMSFKYRMNKEFYERVRPELVMDEDHRHFPEVGKESEYDRLIEELGGVDYCFGGLGINGHVAFNEPPEVDEPKTADKFAGLGTRVLRVSRETKTINGFGYLRGDIKGMPQWCITVGMKQILASRKIYIALNRPWQNGPFKHAVNDPETADIPATLLRRCKNLTYCGTAEIMSK